MRILLCALALALAAPASAQSPTVLEALEHSLTRAADKVAASVVTIEVERTADAGPPASPQQRQPNAMQRLFQRFMAGMRRTHQAYFKRPQGPVTGWIVGADGHIVTSWYNVAGTVTGVRVTLPDGTQKLAKLVGWSKPHDLALLKIEAEGLPALPLASDAPTPIGSFAVVVSRSRVDKRHAVTWGIVSATTRNGNRTIQIDARTNYGNSGGPVVNLKGQLVGSVSSIAHWNRSGQNSGVGYATKAGEIAKLLPRLKKGEKITAPKRPFMGIQGEDASPGVRLTQVVPGSSAAGAKLQVGDVILSLNGKKVAGMMALVNMIRALKVGQTVEVEVRRGETTQKIQMKLGARPEGQ